MRRGASGRSDAGLGVRAHGCEGDAAGRLELGPAGRELDGLPHLFGAHVVEQDPGRAAVERLAHLRQRLRLDLYRQPVDAALESRQGRSDAAGDAEVILLHEDAVVEAGAMVPAAAAADGVLLERAEPGRGLARVEDGRPRPLGQLDEAAGEGGDTAEPADEVERDALAAEDRARGPLDQGEYRRHVGHRRALLEFRPDVYRGVEGVEDGGADRNPADDARLLEQQLRAAVRIRRHERERGRVARADVLAQGRADHALDLLLRQLHRSSTGSWPGWTTRCPANASLSTGKSSRKWTPRLSSRARPHAATWRTSGCGDPRRRVRPSALWMRPASRQSSAPGFAAGSAGVASAS